MNAAEFKTQNHFMGQDVFFQSDLFNATFPFVGTDADGSAVFAEMAQFAWARDAEGPYYKEGTSRVHMMSKAEFNTAVQVAIENAKTTFFFDPSTPGAVPTTPSGTIGGNYEFRVIAAGTFDGQELTPGDKLFSKGPISGTPTMDDFYLNEAESGIGAPAEADEATFGLVKLLTTIRLDDTATHSSSLPTEKAVADALKLTRTDLESQISQLDTTLRGLIQENATQIALVNDKAEINITEIAAIKLKDDEQDGRLDTLTQRADDVQSKSDNNETRIIDLEEYTYRGVDIIVGDNANSSFTIPIPGGVFDNVNHVTYNAFVSDGQGNYRPAQLTVYFTEENGVQVAKVDFSYVPTTGMYKVVALGRFKAAA